MLDLHRTIRPRRLCGRRSRTWLQAGHLVHAQHHFIRPQLAGVEIADRVDFLSKVVVTRHLRRQPCVISPRLQTMTGQRCADRFAADRGHRSVCHQLAADLLTVPLRERSSGNFRTFTGKLDDLNRHVRGKKRACARVPEDRSNRRCRAPENVDTTYEDVYRSSRQQPSPDGTSRRQRLPARLDSVSETLPSQTANEPSGRAECVAVRTTQ